MQTLTAFACENTASEQKAYSDTVHFSGTKSAKTGILHIIGLIGLIAGLGPRAISCEMRGNSKGETLFSLPDPPRPHFVSQLTEIWRKITAQTHPAPPTRRPVAPRWAMPAIRAVGASFGARGRYRPASTVGSLRPSATMRRSGPSLG